MSKRTLIYASIFVLAVISGIIVSSLGKPYDTTVFTLHKIISIGTIILAIILIRKQVKEAGITPAVRTSIIVLSISAAALFATGALMSIGVEGGIIKAVHAVAPVSAASSIVIMNVSFSRKRQENASYPKA